MSTRTVTIGGGSDTTERSDLELHLERNFPLTAGAMINFGTGHRAIQLPYAEIEAGKSIQIPYTAPTLTNNMVTAGASFTVEEVQVIELQFALQMYRDTLTATTRDVTHEFWLGRSFDTEPPEWLPYEWYWSFIGGEYRYRQRLKIRLDPGYRYAMFLTLVDTPSADDGVLRNNSESGTGGAVPSDPEPLDPVIVSLTQPLVPSARGPNPTTTVSYTLQMPPIITPQATQVTVRLFDPVTNANALTGAMASIPDQVLTGANIANGATYSGTFTNVRLMDGLRAIDYELQVSAEIIP